MRPGVAVWLATQPNRVEPLRVVVSTNVSIQTSTGVTPTTADDRTATTHAHVIAADRTCRWCDGQLHADADDGQPVVVCTDCGRDFV